MRKEPDEITGDQALDKEGATLKAHFARVMWIHGPKVYTLALRLTGNTVEAEELARETFVKAYANHSQSRTENNLGAWLYKICLMVWKEQARFTFEEGGTIMEIASSEPEVSEIAAEADQMTALDKALKLLTRQERAFIVLRDMDGKTYEEISELLEVPMNMAKARVARTRDKLRRMLLTHLVNKA